MMHQRFYHMENCMKIKYKLHWVCWESSPKLHLCLCSLVLKILEKLISTCWLEIRYPETFVNKECLFSGWKDKIWKSHDFLFVSGCYRPLLQSCAIFDFIHCGQPSHNTQQWVACRTGVQSMEFYSFTLGRLGLLLLEFGLPGNRKVKVLQLLWSLWKRFLVSQCPYLHIY